MKIVIDTNIWVSFLIGKLLSNLINHISLHKIQIYTSDEQIIELFETFKKPKLQKFINEADTKRLYNFLSIVSKKVEITKTTTICRDAKDNFILNIALSISADYIIAGDKDLLILNPYENIKIISYSEFEKLLNPLNIIDILKN